MPAAPADTAAPGRTRARRPLLRTCLLVLGVLLAVYGTSPVVTNGDSFLVVPTAHSLLTEGDLEISEHLGPGTDGGIAYLRTGDGGRALDGVDLPRQLAPGQAAYDYFPWLTAVLAVPLVAAFELPGLLGVERLDVDRLLATGETGLLNLVGGSVLSALSAVVLTLVAWTLLVLPDPQRRRLAVLVGVGAGLGTSLWSTLSRALWSQSAAVLMLSLCCLFAARVATAQRRERAAPARDAALLGVAAGLAVAARPTSVLAVVALGAWLATTRPRLLPPFLATGAVVAAAWCAVALAAYGRLVPPYYAGDRAGLAGGLAQRVAENLVSPSRGLLVLTPVALLSVVGLVVAVRRRGPLERPLALAAATVVVAHVLAVAGSGLFSGASYGPRYTADTIPFLVVLALPVVQHLAVRPGAGPRLAAAALAVLSIALHAPGAWSRPTACWNVDPTRVEQDQGRLWDWSDPQALRGVRTLLDTGSLREAALGRCDERLVRRAGA